ncbi:MAG: polysaccharide lyase [Myxococcota bacterium]
MNSAPTPHRLFPFVAAVALASAGCGTEESSLPASPPGEPGFGSGGGGVRGGGAPLDEPVEVEVALRWSTERKGQGAAALDGATIEAHRSYIHVVPGEDADVLAVELWVDEAMVWTEVNAPFGDQPEPLKLAPGPHEAYALIATTTGERLRSAVAAFQVGEALQPNPGVPTWCPIADPVDIVDVAFDDANWDPGANKLDRAAMLKDAFEGHPTYGHLRLRIPDPSSSKAMDRVDLVANPDGAGKVLASLVRKDSQPGVNWQLILDDGANEGGFTEACFTYRVRFRSDFDWLDRPGKLGGGKLPGLAGGPPRSGDARQYPTGGACAEDGISGFSARHMWTSHRNAYGRAPLLEQYLYHPSKCTSGDGELNPYFESLAAADQPTTGVCPNPYDVAGGHPFEWLAGRWYEVGNYLKMNSVSAGGPPAPWCSSDGKNKGPGAPPTPQYGADDGQMLGFIDGVPRLSRTDMHWRETDAYAINVMILVNFFGGGDAKWEHPQDEVIYFDDFRIWVPRAEIAE